MMTLLALLGALVFTAFMFYSTFGFVGRLWFQHAVAGLNCLNAKDWAWIIILGLGLIGLWVAWVFLVGLHIHIGVS